MQVETHVFDTVAKSREIPEIVGKVKHVRQEMHPTFLVPPERTTFKIEYVQQSRQPYAQPLPKPTHRRKQHRHFGSPKSKLPSKALCSAVKRLALLMQ